MDKLNQLLSQTYKLENVRCFLIRKKIGHVYKVQTSFKTYCLKLYQNRTLKEVGDIVNLMNFLSSKGVSVPNIIMGSNHQYCFTLDNQVGILMEYIDGEPISIKKHKQLVVQLHREMNQAMKHYVNKLPRYNESYYIDRFINHLKRINFEERKLLELREIGYWLYSNIQKLDEGFCHGDFHTGNMLLKDSAIYLFDFDHFKNQAAILDLITVMDQTDFNTYRHKDILKNVDIMKPYFTKNGFELKNVLSFTPLRHLEVIMNIIDVNGHKAIKKDFYQQQYDWIKKYVDDLKKL
jgi:Ser/Thr protein kinase RdoA (MazF antagonist)